MLPAVTKSFVHVVVNSDLDKNKSLPIPKVSDKGDFICIKINQHKYERNL